MAPQASRPAYIYSFDVLRGLAASNVVLGHFMHTVAGLDIPGAMGRASAVNFWIRQLLVGSLAVTLFFVISGASLTISACSKPESNNKRSFFIKRFFRIYPLYALMILVYFLFRPIYTTYLNWGLVSTDLWLSPQFINPVTAETWFGHLTMTLDFFRIPLTFNHTLWTLPIEMQFYLFFPFLLLLLQTGKLRGIFLLGILLAIIYRFSLISPDRLIALNRLWEFGGGMVIGLYWRPIADLLRRYWVRIFAIITAIVLFEVSRYMAPIPRLPRNFVEVIFCFFVAGIALGFACWKPETSFARFFVSIGRWSYSLYVIHILVIAALTPLIRNVGLSNPTYIIIGFPIVYSVSLLTSRFLYNRFEKPFMQAGARYALRSFRQTQTSITPT